MTYFTGVSSKINVEETPGGDWNMRHPSDLRSFCALMKRSFLLKIRETGTIILEIAATVLFVIFGILYSISFSESDAILNDPIVKDDDHFGSPSYLYAMMQTVGEGKCYVA